jgi:hypothetical protein
LSRYRKPPENGVIGAFPQVMAVLRQTMDRRAAPGGASRTPDQ